MILAVIQQNTDFRRYSTSIVTLEVISSKFLILDIISINTVILDLISSE